MRVCQFRHSPVAVHCKRRWAECESVGRGFSQHFEHEVAAGQRGVKVKAQEGTDGVGEGVEQAGRQRSGEVGGVTGVAPSGERIEDSAGQRNGDAALIGALGAALAAEEAAGGRVERGLGRKRVGTAASGATIELGAEALEVEHAQFEPDERGFGAGGVAEGVEPPRGEVVEARMGSAGRQRAEQQFGGGGGGGGGGPPRAQGGAGA